MMPGGWTQWQAQGFFLDDHHLTTTGKGSMANDAYTPLMATALANGRNPSIRYRLFRVRRASLHIGTGRLARLRFRLFAYVVPSIK